MLGPMLWFEIPRLVIEIDWLLRLLLAGYIIYQRRPSGGTTAWVVVVLAVPFFGVFLYALIGENRLGAKRSHRLAQLYKSWRADFDKLRSRWPSPLDNTPEAHEPLFKIATAAVGIPPIVGNRLAALTDSQDAMRRIAQDIDAATNNVWLSFYIWHAGGVVQDVQDALVRAANRGVACTLMADGVGSKAFLKSDAARQLAEQGVDVIPLLPVNLLRVPFKRLDLRNHRKIAVIDDRIAYTGSLNMADPDFFNQHAGVGKWIDIMVRVDGPAVEPLKMAILQDYCFERGVTDEHELVDRPPMAVAHEDGAVVQVLPSGPGINHSAILQLMTGAMHAARHTLTLTTPYFVPDESMLNALKGAAIRGVDTTLIVPMRVDSPIIRYAGTAFFNELLDAGVKIARYTGGLLHAKAMTIDGYMTIIGSANMDMRSFYINEEITLIVSDQVFAEQIDLIQSAYIRGSEILTKEAWSQRTSIRRFTERALGMMSPLL